MLYFVYGDMRLLDYFDVTFFLWKSGSRRADLCSSSILFGRTGGEVSTILLVMIMLIVYLASLWILGSFPTLLCCELYALLRTCCELDAQLDTSVSHFQVTRSWVNEKVFLLSRGHFYFSGLSKMLSLYIIHPTILNPKVSEAKWGHFSFVVYYLKT